MTSSELHSYDRTPPAYCAQILSKFGQNPYGENIFRVVWSESQTELVGGVWEDRVFERGTTIVKDKNFTRDDNPVIARTAAYRRVLKYSDAKCWILEKWLPCSYSPWLWNYRFMDVESGLNILGPYPEFGDYHCCYRLTDRGKYREPSAFIIEYYARMIQAGLEYTEAHRKAAFEARIKKQQRDFDNRFDAIFHDSQAAGGTTNLFQAVSGPKTNRKSVDDVKIIERPDTPWTPAESGNRQV